MSGGLDNPINWSFPVGRLFGIRIRVHVLFVLIAVYMLLAELGSGGGWRGVSDRFISVLLLFFIVLTHEFGHCFGARYAGGEAHEILLWPLGGLAMTSPPHTARGHMITVVAGPAVNVLYLFLTGAVLIAFFGGPGAVPWNPFRPFSTGVWIESSVHLWLVIFFALNWIILLFNLAPVFPLDGGRILQCLLWPKQGFARATWTATGVGMVGAIAIGLIGLVSQATLMLAIAVFGYLTCWQQRQMIKSGMFESENEFGYDFSQGYTSLEQAGEKFEKKPSWWQRQKEKRAAAKLAKEQARQEELQREVDRILEKIARDGINALTTRERQLLAKETERQRSEQ